MKKLLLTIAIICTLSGAAFGTTSEDVNVYVRQDVFSARMEAFMAEIRLGNEQLRTEIRELSGRIDGWEKRMDDNQTATANRINDIQITLSARIDDLKTIIYWGLSILGLILGFAIFAPALGDFLRNFSKPSITLEDVERLIDTKLRTMQLQ